jgi:hypothetical protein
VLPCIDECVCVLCVAGVGFLTLAQQRGLLPLLSIVVVFSEHYCSM